MKSLISKTVATVSLVSMLSTSVFANQTLSKIINDAQNGVKSEVVYKNLSQALVDGTVKAQDIQEYLQENISARDYQELNQAIESKDYSNLASALSNVGGAEYRYSACRSAAAVSIVVGGVAAAAMLAASLTLYTPNEYETELPNNLKKNIDYYQIQIDAFKAAGLPDTNYVVRDKILALESARKDYDDAIADLKSMEGNAEKKSKVYKAGLITLGITGTVLLSTEIFCKGL